MLPIKATEMKILLDTIIVKTNNINKTFTTYNTNGSKDESRGRYHNTQQNKREDKMNNTNPTKKPR